jgi:hypothetical protein
MKLCIVFAFGFFWGILGFYLYQVDTYSHLRLEINMKTGVDITYPNNYNHCYNYNRIKAFSCKMNDTIYGGKLNTESCR